MSKQMGLAIPDDEYEKLELFMETLEDNGYSITKNQFIRTAIKKHIDRITDGGDAVYDVDSGV